MLHKNLLYALTLAVIALIAAPGQANAAHLSRHHGCDPCCDPCQEMVTICMPVCNPCTGCTVNVELCVPACCATEAPCCSSRPGLLRRGVVTYNWCCGYTAVIRFKKCGDYTVRYK